MNVKILRQETPSSASYWERFVYDGPENNSVAGLLDYLNHHDDIVNAQGQRTGRIGWECSCLQGVCGACAMVINGVPALACMTMLSSLRGGELELRPLQKFPVLRDLEVDRSSMQENLKKANLYIGEYQPARDTDHALHYAAAKCLKCGLCLEVCPNYGGGETFFGAVFANDCCLTASRNREKGPEIARIYAEHFARDCSKALSCMAVCPMQIPTIASMARLNRLRPGRKKRGL